MHPTVNKKDALYLILAVAIALLLLFNFISTGQNQSYGGIYTPILTIALILISLAIATNGRLFGEVIYGNIRNDKQLYFSVGVGLVVGGAIAYALINNLQPLSFVGSPLPFAISGTAAAGLGTYAILTIVGPEIEELMFASALLPTVASELRRPKVFSVMAFFAGMIFYFIFQVIVLAAVFFLFAFLIYISSRARLTLFGGDLGKFSVAVAFTAFAFAMFHLWAYGNAGNPLLLLEQAFAFRVGISFLNYILQDTISGRIIHSMNNAAIGSMTLGIPIANFGIAVFIYTAMIVIIYKAQNGRLA
ncbi:MAG: hypothetical protein KGH62_01945 [Candidatus Micrarchaeota archaeon]|nr:hypothetical protein [Candidatus Micrarchaeota archaeon]